MSALGDVGDVRWSHRPHMMPEESYLDDYTPYTSQMKFRVGESDAGRGLLAAEELPRGEDLLDEVPLIAWPAPSSAAQNTGGKTAIFCDTCLCVFSRDSMHVKCSDAACGARFCSGICAAGGFHSSLCGGALPALRAWQVGTAHDSQYGVESIARCNARIVQNVLSFSAEYGLEAPVALANALRPWERICAFPSECELVLKGASAEALAEALRTHTLAGLAATLGAHLSADEARSMALELTSVPHVTGLIQRLLLNTFQWQHPTHGALKFGGVFLLTCNANHDCAPNAQVVPSWTRSIEDGAEGGEDGDAEGGAAAAVGSSGAGTSSADAASGASAEGAKLEGSARDSFSLVLRTLDAVDTEAELRLSYVDVHLPLAERRDALSHWAFRCVCARCQAEEAEETETGTVSSGPVSAATSSSAGQTCNPNGKKRKAPADAPCLSTRDRPQPSAALLQRLSEAATRRTGDARFSVLPAVVPPATMLQVKRARPSRGRPSSALAVPAPPPAS